jgi:hypothetical protein
VPNSIIARARLVNRSLPTPMRRDMVQIRIETAAAPDTCITTMKAALLTCRLLLEAPAPMIECTSLEGDGNVFQVWFSVPDAEHLANARTELLSQLHRHLRHAGIALGVPGLATVSRIAPPTGVEVLAQSDLFGVIEQSQRDLIAAHLTEVLLQPGDMLIEQGTMPFALFFIASGTLEITVQQPEQPPRAVNRIGPGESIGAIGLITGSPYAATATALTAVRAYRLDKAAIAAAITQLPALRTGLEALAERAQANLRGDATAPEHHAPPPPELFLAKLRNFLSLLGR